MTDKPDAEIIGADGNIFVITGIASNALQRAGLRDQADEMKEKVKNSDSYHSALGIILQYINPVGKESELWNDDDDDDDDDWGDDDDEFDETCENCGGWTDDEMSHLCDDCHKLAEKGEI